MRNDLGRQRLVPRFALTSLVVFAAVGVALWWVLAATIRERTESTAQEHAEFVTHSVIGPALSERDLIGPVGPDSARYEELRRLVVSEVLGIQFPVVGLKVWSEGDKVLFSDERTLVGRTFPPAPGLVSAFDGRVVSAPVDLSRPENVFERQVDHDLLATFIPLPQEPGEDPRAVVEIDTDIAVAAVPIGRPFRLVGIALLGGLAAIYVIQLPVVRRLGRTLGQQNRRLEVLLRQEQQTVEELRELNRRQGEFLAVTSHELRTPLTSIAGYAKTLMKPAFRDDVAAREEFLGTIEKQAERLGALIENILAVTQLSETAHPPGNAALSKAADRVVARLGQASKRVEIKIAGDLPNVSVDGRLLELVVGNLLDNALKFSPDGSPCQLGARQDGSEVAVWVQDGGIGIAPEHIDRIFDRFYQVDSSPTRRQGGVGLGLHLVKAIVVGAGGTVTVESVVNQGARFIIRLPVADRRAGGQGVDPGSGAADTLRTADRV
jgi:signal transduction histidine kinase